jgi:hypothetical protein
MGYFSEMLQKEYGNLDVKEIYRAKLGETDVEIVEVSAEGNKFIATFQSSPLKDGVYRWSLIITSPNNTRTLKGMDKEEGIKLAIRSSIDAMLKRME